MLIKVLCPCGTKFAFEVEPIQGHMPVGVTCPECGADSTLLANRAIAGQLAARPATAPEEQSPPATTPKVRIHITPHRGDVPPQQPSSPMPSPPPAAGAPRSHPHIARSHAATAPALEPPQSPCPRHPLEKTVETCRVCGKPICLKCMESFGYVCSVFCRTKAETEGIELPHYARQRSVIEAGARSKARLWGALTIAGVLLLSGIWMWWTFFGTKPGVIFSRPIPRAERGVIYELVGQNEILVLREEQIALLDLTQGGREMWSTPLNTASTPGKVESTPKPAKAAPKQDASLTPEIAAGDLATDAARSATRQPATEDEADAEEDWGFFPYHVPELLASSDDIWLKFPDRIARHDRKTGARKQDIPLRSPVYHLAHGHSSIVAVSGDRWAVRTLTRISLPEGTVKTTQLPPPANAAAILARATGTPRASAPATGEDEDGTRLEPVEVEDQFHPAGDSVVEFKAKLIEKKVHTRPAMKPKPKDGGLMESGRLSAGQSLDAAVELLNDMSRQTTGGTIQEDVSRYQVTVRRLLGGDVAPWTGEVTGEPGFVPLKTVDIVFGATDVIVLDKNNQKRWSARLSYRMGRAVSLGLKDAHHAPCAETADALYVFDQGMLTCFELSSGQARWRLTSVGVSRVQFDAEGRLYVTATTATPDAIDFPKQINIRNRPQPVIMKVDPASGKVLWKVTSRGDECILSGKFVYAARSSSGLTGGAYFNLYRLNPANGCEQWHFYQERWPRNTGYHGNRFLLQWKDELQVMRFLTF